MAEKQTQSRTFADFVETLDYLEVCRVTINPKGKFEVPSERDGRIVQVKPATRKALAKFCRQFADRLENGELDRRRDKFRRPFDRGELKRRRSVRK